MVTPNYIIDGYNLLHCFRELGRLADSDLELARSGLVRRLAAFKGRKRIRLKVVFDGRPDDGQLLTTRPLGIETVFSGAQSADERIVKMVRVLRRPKSWTVVSSDRWVKDHVAVHGVQTLNSGRFAELLPDPGARTSPAQGEKPEMSAQDVSEWEEYFRSGREGAGE